MNDEWEDVPADDFEDAPASDEWEDVDTSMDQGPPLSAANQPEEFHPSASQASALGWTSGVPGLQPAAAAIRSGIDSLSTKRKLLDDYQMQRERLRRMDAAASTEHPGAYYGANIPANVATAIAAGELVPAKVASVFAKGRALPVLGRILGNTALSAAQEASQGTLDAEHVGRDVLAAEGANIMLKGALKPVKMVAKGSQVPQKIANAFYRLMGRGAADDAIPSTIDGDDLASRLARSAQRGEADVSGNEVIPEVWPGTIKEPARAAAEMNPKWSVPVKEFSGDIAATSRKAKDEALRMHAPDRLLHADPVKNMRLEAQEIRDALEKRKAEFAEARAKFPDDSVDMDMASYRGPPPIPGRKIPQSPVRGNARDFDPDTGPLVRNTATKAESKERWGDADKPEGWSKRWKKNTSGDVEGDELRAEYLRKHSHESNVNAKPPTGKPVTGTAEEAAELDKTADKISQRTKENRDIDFDQTMTKARGKVSEAAKRDMEELKRVREARETAGRKHVENAGAAAGVVGGLSAGGTAGMLGALKGREATKAAMNAIDKIGDTGKKLEALKSWAEKLAAKDTAMGRAAKRALEKDYDGFIQRMSVLVDKWD